MKPPPSLALLHLLHLSIKKIPEKSSFPQERGETLRTNFLRAYKLWSFYAFCSMQSSFLRCCYSIRYWFLCVLSGAVARAHLKMILLFKFKNVLQQKNAQILNYPSIDVLMFFSSLAGIKILNLCSFLHLSSFSTLVAAENTNHIYSRHKTMRTNACLPYML